MRHSEAGLIRSIQVATAIFGGGLVLFGLSHTLWASLLLLTLVGFGMMQCASAINMVIQALVPEDKRARVLSYYTMAFFGAAPFGSLLAGALAHRIGAPHTVILTGACCIAGSVWFAFELPHLAKLMAPVEHQPALPSPGVELAAAVQEAAA
jgi:MFS family permease